MKNPMVDIEQSDVEERLSIIGKTIVAQIRIMIIAPMRGIAVRP